MSEPPATDPVITGRRDWEPHQPDSVIVIGTAAQKKNNEKILTIEGMEGKFSPNEAYSLAKKGSNRAAAFAYAEYIIDSNPQIVADLIARHKNEKPILLPIDANEYATEGRHNPIARATAVILAERTGWELDNDNGKPPIYQSNKVGRTGAPLIRFEKHPTFEGPVEAGRNYIIIDDHFHNGGTMRSAMDHIESNGGKVVGASTLMSSHFGGQLKPSPHDIAHAKNILGEENYNALHKKIFGVDGTHNLFTHAELEAFSAVRNQILRQHKNDPAKTDDASLRRELYEKIDHEIRPATEAGQTTLANGSTNRPIDGSGRAEPAAGHSGIDRVLPSSGPTRSKETVIEVKANATQAETHITSPVVPPAPEVTASNPAPSTVQEPPTAAKPASGTTPELNTGLDGINGKIGTAAIAISITDAMIKHDPVKAAEIGGGAVAVHAGMTVAGRMVGVEAVPVLGQAVGGAFAAADSYTAATTGHTARAVVSGTEATLYTISAGAWTATAADCWNPTGVAPATVAVVSGGAAVTMTIGRTIYDSWNIVTGWFGHQETPPPPAATPSEPLPSPIPAGSLKTSRNFNDLKINDSTTLLAAATIPVNSSAADTTLKLATAANQAKKSSSQFSGLDA